MPSRPASGAIADVAVSEREDEAEREAGDGPDCQPEGGSDSDCAHRPQPAPENDPSHKSEHAGEGLIPPPGGVRKERARVVGSWRRGPGLEPAHEREPEPDH